MCCWTSQYHFLYKHHIMLTWALTLTGSKIEVRTTPTLEHMHMYTKCMRLHHTISKTPQDQPHSHHPTWWEGLGMRLLREILSMIHAWFLSRRRLWETEIIKGGCIKEFQAVPFDVSFLEHMVFIHWSVVVGVLQKREWTDKRQNIKIGGSVLLKYLCWLSTSTSYLAWQATLFAERGRVWSHCNHWFVTMAETWCDQRDLCFRRLHNFCCHGVFWYSNYVTMDVTIYCADCMTTRQRQYDHPLSVSAKGVACETTSYPGLHPSISYSTRVPGKCITCNKWWKKPWVQTRLVAQWVPGYTEMVTQVWEHRHVIQTYILTAISNSVFSGCVLLVKTPIKVLENASTSPPNGTKYIMLQCSNLMKHW